MTRASTSTFTWAMGLLLGATLGLPTVVKAQIVVGGMSDPWLAGMPNGSTASQGNSSAPDVAPAQSPVLVTGVAFNPGDTLNFDAFTNNANPGVSHGPVGVYDPPDGNGSYRTHYGGPENGISDINAPQDSLVGVFLSDTEPDLNTAPGALDFSSSGLGLDFTTLAPALQQVFFIGDGVTSGDVIQNFIVPAGATRLYLGTIDGFQWWNNSGSFLVDVTDVNNVDVVGTAAPLPTAAWTGLTMLALLAGGQFVRRRLAA